jgi:hypothetical protein
VPSPQTTIESFLFSFASIILSINAGITWLDEVLKLSYFPYRFMGLNILHLIHIVSYKIDNQKKHLILRRHSLHLFLQGIHDALNEIREMELDDFFAYEQTVPIIINF